MSASALFKALILPCRVDPLSPSRLRACSLSRFLMRGVDERLVYGLRFGMRFVRLLAVFRQRLLVIPLPRQPVETGTVRRPSSNLAQPEHWLQVYHDRTPSPATSDSSRSPANIFRFYISQLLPCQRSGQ